MKNPKTTIVGWVILGSSLLAIVLRVVSTGELSAHDMDTVFTAAAGVGLIAAKDGGKK